MKEVVSISLGSSKRNHEVNTSFLGQDFLVKRVGTDGNMEKAIELIKELDGKVAAFGMGGIDLYIMAGDRRYTFRQGKKLKNAALITPMVDGSGLKNTLERKVIKYLADKKIIEFTDKKVLLVSGVDRFGMAEALEEEGAIVTYGDLIFGLGLPLPIRSLKTLDKVARVIAPIVTQMPIELIYPTGKAQEENSTNKYGKYYHEADIIAGDYLFISKYLPLSLKNKIIITNTVTAGDLDILQKRGLTRLITTTPELNGRSFGTNVMEAVLVALAGKTEELSAQDYDSLLDKLKLTPRILELSEINYA